MKKKTIKIFFSVIIFFTSLMYHNRTFASVKVEDTIIRNIITHIEWKDETQKIIIHKIYIQRLPDKTYYIYPLDHTVSVENLNNKTLTDKEAREFVKKNSPEVFMANDSIFGRKVEVYKDFSDQENIPTEDEINRTIEQAKQQIEQDWAKGKDAIKSESYPIGSWIRILYIPLILLFLIVLRVFIIVKRRMGRK